MFQSLTPHKNIISNYIKKTIINCNLGINEIKYKNNINGDKMSFILFLFCIGSFVGWVMECFFKYFSGQSIEKAGMGKLPFCALYGNGTILLYIAVYKNTDNVVLTFLSSAFILTSIELLAGVILDYVFDMRLWDYSNKKLSINPYICGELMITWGVAGVLFVKFLLPFFRDIFLKIDTNFTFYLLAIITIVICINYAFAAYSGLKNKKAYV